MECVSPVDKGFFPLDSELELLPGKLTPQGHETLVRLSGWMPFGKAVETMADFMGVTVSQIVAKQYTETAGAAYVQMQEEEVGKMEREMPETTVGADKLQISADGAMVPLRHGIWAEVRTLVIGEVQAPLLEQGEKVIHTRHLSYFSRKVSAQEFQRLALVEFQRRGVEQAEAVAAVMDGAEWEQGLVDFHCPQAIRILDFPHALEHVNPIGEFLHGEHTSESQAWLKEHSRRLKQEGPDVLLRELNKLQRKHPDAQVISSNLAYLNKRKSQMQYPLFQAQGWPIGSGIVESGNKLVVQARLKGAGMHWEEKNVNPMLALRNILCSGRWKEDWPKIETRLRQQTRRRQRLVHRMHHPPCGDHPLAPTTKVARALLGDFGPIPPEPSTQTPPSPKPKKNTWRNFKHGKALFQRNPPKI
jgi:hypothetical protein